MTFFAQNDIKQWFIMKWFYILSTVLVIVMFALHICWFVICLCDPACENRAEAFFYIKSFHLMY